MVEEKNMTEARETAIEIISVFEHLLDRYEIDIPDGERKDNPEEARIYGQNYFDLEYEITEILEKFRLEN